MLLLLLLLSSSSSSSGYVVNYSPERKYFDSCLMHCLYETRSFL